MLAFKRWKNLPLPWERGRGHGEKATNTLWGVLQAKEEERNMVKSLRSSRTVVGHGSEKSEHSWEGLWRMAAVYQRSLSTKKQQATLDRTFFQKIVGMKVISRKEMSSG